MLTLGDLVRNPELELTFADSAGATDYDGTPISAIITLSLQQMVQGEPQRHLEPGSLVLITEMPFRIRGRAEVALETLLEQMFLDQCVALIVAPSTGTALDFPQAVRDLSLDLAVPLLVTTATTQRWDSAHEHLQQSRLTGVQRDAARLDELLGVLPAQLSEPAAMQRIVDWLAHALEAEVLVSEPERVLAASPPGAAESLASSIIRRSHPSTAHEGPSAAHTRIFSIASSPGTDIALAVSRTTPAFHEADMCLLRHAAKFMGLLVQARRENQGAAAGSDATKEVALELLFDAQVDKARRVMAAQTPGLLEADTARVYVVDTAPALRDAAARCCQAVTAERALVVPDPADDRRVLIIHPLQPGHSDNVAAELQRQVLSLGTGVSLGGSGEYSLARLSAALNEAITAQRFALHHPDSIAMSAHHTDLVTLLPAHDAQRWACRLLEPLMRHAGSWAQMRETLPVALAYPYTVAARRLDVHRNTVTRRVNRAAHLLDMDLNSVTDRIAVDLAVELANRHPKPNEPVTPSQTPPTMHSLLATPQTTAWADWLLDNARRDGRKLLATATSWLTHNLRLEPTASTVGLSVTTVRSHLQALEQHIDRDLTSLAGQRDLQYALHIQTGEPDIADIDPQRAHREPDHVQG
ncbi:helix-turn-helix domain-containing protein [Streptomyces spectabilis]|uniref:helix-turn-helix domain-containing protein n=1 Tax=Streptomyces spectabilis TaxID=68270 RepID=UPI00340C3ABD